MNREIRDKAYELFEKTYHRNLQEINELRKVGATEDELARYEKANEGLLDILDELMYKYGKR